MKVVKPASDTQTLRLLHEEGKALLAASGVDTPALDARLLIEHFTATTQMDLLMSPDLALTPAAVANARAALTRRAAGEPVHRIIGVRGFYGLDLVLSSETLEPRPDTETLVDAMLPFARAQAQEHGRCRILDLGAGTGAIALALLSQVKLAVATGVDISQDALNTARRNAESLGLGERYQTIRSSWFAEISGEWDVIVSNPPYISTKDIASLSREVRNFEPLAALDGGADGLDAYREIAAHAASFLAAGGRIGLEIGFDQKDSVTVLFAVHGYERVDAMKDLGGNDRVLVFRLVT